MELQEVSVTRLFGALYAVKVMQQAQELAFLASTELGHGWKDEGAESESLIVALLYLEGIEERQRQETANLLACEYHLVFSASVEILVNKMMVVLIRNFSINDVGNYNMDTSPFTQSLGTYIIIVVPSVG